MGIGVGGIGGDKKVRDGENNKRTLNLSIHQLVPCLRRTHAQLAPRLQASETHQDF